MSQKRKISFADLASTFGRAAPIYNPQPVNHPPVLTPQQEAAKAQEDKRRQEIARRQAKRPTDRTIAEDLTDVCIGDGVERYRKLRDLERKLDAVMMQKRLDVSEGVGTSSSTREGTLRVWISNTAEGQPWQVIEEGGGAFGEDGTFDFGDNSQARYRVKIEARLLPDLEEADGEQDGAGDAMEQDGAEPKKKATMLPQPNEKTKLSHFFKQITIDFDRPASLQPDGFASIEWKKAQVNNPQIPATDPEANFDCLEFERKSDEEINVTIKLTRDELPERFKLSKPLADLLDTEESSRAGVVAGIWEYVRANGLQEDDEKRSIVCDERLKAVFEGHETLLFPHVPDMVLRHLQPLPPICLPYTIRVDKDYISPSDESATASAPTIYDIRVPLPSPLIRQMQAIHSSPSHLASLRAITQLDDDLALMVQKVNHTNAKRKFYDSLARDPTSFIKRWVSSQQRDLEVILAEGGRGNGVEEWAGEEFRKGGKDSIWAGTLAKESVGLWLARQKAH
ncbi:hypothetical protein MBLNU459_g0114t1 [Dothideomycetes sp. NU459]